MSTKTDISKKRMLDALEKSLGIITTACRTAGIARSMHYKWLEDDPEYKAAVDDIANIAHDFVESQLHKQIAKGNPLSTIFYLKCKAKSRGYVESQDLNVNMKGPIKLLNIDPIGDNEDDTADDSTTKD